MTGALLATESLVRRFGGVAAVDGVDLRVPQGEFRAIIGPNGAGKTTLFNLLSGDLRPSAGRIRFGGREIGGLPPHRLARRGIGRTFQISNVFLEASVRENIRLAILGRERRCWNMIALASGLCRDEVEKIVALVGLANDLEREARDLSYGDRRRLELALTLAGRPKLLLLDEPTCGMSVADRPALVEQIREIVKREHLTAVLIEHDMDIVFSIADRITVMHRGKILADGTPEAIANDPEVQRIYLGGTGHA